MLPTSGEAVATTTVWTFRRRAASTAAADVGNLRFYQRCGFRLRSIDRDAFTPEAGYATETVIDGIELRDRVWMDRPLGASTTDRRAGPT